MYDFDVIKLNINEFQAKGFEDGSIVADPLFRDPANYDFTLTENSPVKLIGFKPIDTSDVGAKR